MSVTPPDPDELIRIAHRCNERMMAVCGIDVGQVRQWGHRRVIVLAPADVFPRNGKGIVRCAMEIPDGERWETHCWPETVAHWPLVEDPS